MKTVAVIVLLALSGVMAGCATTCERPYPNAKEEAALTLGKIHEACRAPHRVGDWMEYGLVSDTRLVSAGETLLLHFSHDKEISIRRCANNLLIGFGTLPAFEQGLKAAHDEAVTEQRAVRWATCVALLHPPRWKPPQTDGDKNISTNEKVHSILGEWVSDIPPLKNYGPVPVWPAGLERSRLLQEIIAQYKNDDGCWSVAYTDRIPYVPFYATRGTRTFTVRDAIVEALLGAAVSDPQLMDAFRAFARHPDKAIQGPAQRFLNDWEAAKNWRNLLENPPPGTIIRS